VDGSYFLFPEGSPRSGPEQHEAILHTAHAAGIGCTLHTPTEVWSGNEVAKRTFLARLALTVAEPMVDWLVRLDADEWVQQVPGDLRERLEATEYDVAEFTLWWRDDQLATEAGATANRFVDNPIEHTTTIPGLMRALPNLRVEGAHYVWVGDKDGESVYLNGRHDLHDLAPALDCHDLRIEHRRAFRSKARAKLAQDYYALRDSIGEESMVETFMGGVNGDAVKRPPPAPPPTVGIGRPETAGGRA
jgi:hypothetical protein